MGNSCSLFCMSTATGTHASRFFLFDAPTIPVRNFPTSTSHGAAAHLFPPLPNIVPPPQCINGGTCNPPDHQETCACPRDFSGSGCSNAVTRCSGGFFCDNDGTCKIPGPGCVCPAEYSGIRCDVANVVEQCTLTDGFCLHGGVCFGSDENKPCNCRYNQGGKNCEVLNVERCDDDGDVYCQNDGVCNSANTACTCAFGFMGLTCGEVNYAQINSRGGGGSDGIAVNVAAAVAVPFALVLLCLCGFTGYVVRKERQGKPLFVKVLEMETHVEMAAPGRA